ncbi:hypothetical protein C8J56DRAFT_890595 [Mycena floridula]|nr:hypothetical protein C8J56DRAFT_890595 [Mycena floridula]
MLYPSSPWMLQANYYSVFQELHPNSQIWNHSLWEAHLWEDTEASGPPYSQREARTSRSPLFELVPPSFHDYCFKFYQDLGSPTITRNNVWDVYLFTLDGFRRLDDHAVDLFTPEWNASFTLGCEDRWDDDALPQIQDQELLQAMGHHYQGGVNRGWGPSEDIQDGPNVAAQFSDDEDSALKGTYEHEQEFFDLTGPEPFDW